MTGQDDWDKLSGQEQSNVQVGVTDMTSRVSELMHDAFGFGRMRAPEQSNFEGHDLNDMIDIVENTNPSDLESAGEALWKAQKAISDAATELRGHLTAAEDDWKGEAGKAFQIWGKGLAGHADALADYAKAAGVQITSAGTGLASVRSAMPPRDSRLVRKSVADIPVVARVETNDEYTAATKVEGHRQEAINQMNRLSSFYVVSEESLKGLEPPTFEAMPNVGVPKPSGERGAVFRTNLIQGRSSITRRAPRARQSSAIRRSPRTPTSACSRSRMFPTRPAIPSRTSARQSTASTRFLSRRRPPP